MINSQNDNGFSYTLLDCVNLYANGTLTIIMHRWSMTFLYLEDKGVVPPEGFDSNTICSTEILKKVPIFVAMVHEASANPMP